MDSILRHICRLAIVATLIQCSVRPAVPQEIAVPIQQQSISSTFGSGGNLDDSGSGVPIEPISLSLESLPNDGLAFVSEFACDEIWFVSARTIDCPSFDLSQLHVQRWSHGHWIPTSGMSDLVALHEQDPREAVIYIHGNRTNEFHAKSRGLEVHRNLFGCMKDREPVRFIVWAWNSDKIRRLSTDFQVKSARAVRMGAILAATTTALQSDPPLLIGYSLGCQVIASATNQYGMYACHGTRVAVIAPVLDCRFACRQFDSNKTYCEAMVFSNSKDSVTRAARKFCRLSSRDRGLIFELESVWGTQGQCNTQRIDITHQSSHDHSIVKYSALPIVQHHIEQLFRRNCLTRPLAVNSVELDVPKQKQASVEQ